ncbi:MAG: lipoprotein-releasing ABC transporter permease subunit [Rickettsiales bacterium]|jgi:lipoprotein-releasing system permease protein|nr:lipoprotein-releasing ABC transporter permease subunit [Rickettsiales bacterium]
MSLGYEFFIALRYLRDRRKEKFISLTTYFSFIGIMLGVGTLIVVMSVMNGFREELVSKIVGANAHIGIFLRGESAENYEEIIDILKDDEDIEYLNPLVESPVMFISGSLAIGGLARAIRSKDLVKKKVFYGSLRKREEMDDFDSAPVVIVGSRLAESLGLEIGDSLRIVSPGTNMTLLGPMARVKTYRIFDKFESGMHEYDASVAFLPFELGRLQFGHPNSVGSIEIFLREASSAPRKLEEIRTKLEALGHSFSLLDWKNANSGLIAALNTERNVMFLILLLIIVVAAFNIVTSLVMLVMDKKKQIALLKTIGVSDGGIVRIFFLCGASLGFLGTSSGAVLGYLFASNIENLRRTLESVFKVDLFNPVVYYLSQLPSRVYISDVLWICGTSMALSIAAALYPSLWASRIGPVEILRNE